MGSQSTYHGLTGISRRRLKANPAKRAQKVKANERKKENLNEISEALKNTPEVG